MKFIIRILFLLFLFTSCSDNSIGVNYELDYDPNHEIVLINKKKSGDGYDIISINGHILYYGYSDDYVIVMQKPRDSIYNHKERLRYNEMMNKIFDSHFNQFWILEVKNDILYGPFNKAEYLRMRTKIGVPENLKINYSTLDFYQKDDRKDIQYKNPDSDVVDIKNLKGNKI